MSRDSVVGTATRYGLDGQGSILSRGKKFFCSSQYPELLRGQPNLLANGYRGLHPQV
jgi:hypothetical protein